MELDHVFWAVLQAVPGIGSVQMNRLMEYFPNGESVWRSSKKDLYFSRCMERGAYESFLSVREKSFPSVEKLAKEWEGKGIAICTIKDENYPDILKNIYNCPALLYYKGVVRPKTNRLAVVGSRKYSPYGKNVAEGLCARLAESGVTIVSGAARGIDAAAHQGALQKGRTVAVLGCGIDIAYPAENRKLLEHIAANGAVVSEYAPGTPPQPAFFPARNRIISGLCWGTVVVEAAAKSGSLITAEMALSEGRDVFAVPGSVYSPQSEGCHHLIQQGAKLVMRAEDILTEYSWEQLKPAKHEAADHNAQVTGMSKDENDIFQLLSADRALSVDEIICKLRKDVSNISFILLQMELRGLIKEQMPRAYVRAVKEDIL